MVRKIWILVLAVFALAACTRGEIEPFHEEEEEPQQTIPEIGTDLINYYIEVDGKKYRPIDDSGTMWFIRVPAGTDITSLVSTFTHNAASVTIKEVEQESGVTVNNFSSIRNGLTYTLVSATGETKDYTVKVIDTKMPVVSINTENSQKIKNREVWVPSTMRICNTDGSVTKLGNAEVRGRGNWTWEKYPKKPYAIKLEEKQEVLGMPKHKRWVLLAQYRGFIGNPLMFEATRRAPLLGWAPRGCFVELVLNGKFQGLYYLCEQIKIDDNRVNITKLKDTDLTYPNISGGYMLEYDQVYDEEYKFTSSTFSLPVQLKAPDDSVPDAQFNYIRDFINDMEVEIKKIGTSQESHYRDYLDMENFAEYWMVLETIGNYEAWKPRSVKMYKGRDGVDSPKGTVCKLKAGPLWDQELFLVDHEFNTKDAHYFKYLFKDLDFVAAVKEHWQTYKSNILGNDKYCSFLEYLDQIVDLIEYSAKRDLKFWGNGYFTLEDEVATVRNGFVSKINWMDSKIKSF